VVAQQPEHNFRLVQPNTPSREAFARYCQQAKPQTESLRWAQGRTW